MKRARALLLLTTAVCVPLVSAYGVEPVVMTFDCDTEGFTVQQGDTFGGTLRHDNSDGHGKMVITHDAPRQEPLDPSVDYSLISRPMVVDTDAYDRVAMGITINGVQPEDSVPWVLVTYVDGELVWHPNQRIPGGTSVFRFDPGTNPAWGGGNTNILRFDIARLGDLPEYFDHSQVSYEIDWIAVYAHADDPAFTPAAQDTHPECLPVAIPDVRGMSETDAIAALREKHFVAGIQRGPYGSAPEGYVAAQSPSPGALLKPRSIVALSVAEPYRQYRVAEFTFTAATAPGDAGDLPAFDVRFTDPEGTVYDVPGFWDGGTAWKARLNPLIPGDWEYATEASGDTSLDGLSGTFTVLPARGANPLQRHGGVLRVSKNQRYLTYSDGTPFHWLGDTWWFCPGALVPYAGGSNPDIDSAYQHLIDHRAEQGFSVVQMAFLNSGDMATPDGAREHAREMDYYMEYANRNGMLPVIGLTFHSGMDTKTLAEWKAQWRYVIARIGAYGVTWLITGEYNADNGPLEDRIPKVMALGQYIKDTDPYHRAMTVHPWAQSVDSRDAWEEPWYDFIMFQGGHGGVPPRSVYQSGLDHLPTRPVLEGECRYDHIRGFSAADVRDAAYRAIQYGCFGYTYGAHGLWYPTQSTDDQQFWQDWGQSPPWWQALEYTGGDQMGHLKSLYEAVEWWRLEPMPQAASDTRVLVTGDGNQVFMVYFTSGLPASETVSLTSAANGAAYRATWFDPRTGLFTKVSQPLTAVGNALPLPSREDNRDWALILRNLDATVAVPDVKGAPKEEATRTLRARGLEAAYTGYDGQGGYVSDQEPAAGSIVSPETTVTLRLVEREEAPNTYHSADTNEDGALDVSEVLRVIQLYSASAYHCNTETIDGYAPGNGDTFCTAHTADYAPQDWRLDLSEVLRLLQLASYDAINACDEGEDGFCAL